jgi:hypothetical protein
MSKLSEWYDIVDAELDKISETYFTKSPKEDRRTIDDLDDRLLGLRMLGVSENSFLWDWAESVPTFGYGENYCCFFLGTDVVNHKKEAPYYWKNKEWRPEDPIWAIENLAMKYPTLDSYERIFVTLGFHYGYDGSFLCCVDDGVNDVYFRFPSDWSNYTKEIEALPQYQQDSRDVAVRLGTFDEFLKLLLDDIRSDVLSYQISESLGINMGSSVLSSEERQKLHAALDAHPDYLGYDLMYERALALIGEHFAKLG